MAAPASTQAGATPGWSLISVKSSGARLGLDTFSNAGGVIADDFDNDDYIDLFVSSTHTSEPVRYFRNNRDGTFTERSREAGLAGILGGLNLVQADYDNDGDLDLLILRGAWLFAGGWHPNSLIRNNGDHTFVDVTFAAGLGEVHYPTQTASWADYDNDGDLDLYVGNESTDQLQAPCQLFQNNGDGTFTDVAAAAGVTNDRFTKGVVFGDFDGDRFADIYVSNLTAPNRLYRNGGNGKFTDVARGRGVTTPNAGFAGRGRQRPVTPNRAPGSLQTLQRQENEVHRSPPGNGSSPQSGNGGAGASPPRS